MGTVSRVHTFSAGSVLTAAQLNNEFDNLLTSSAINGGLDATNLGVTAGQITASKALVVDSSRNLDDTTTTNMINNLTLSGTLKLIDDQALTLGTNDDITVKYDETTNDALEIAAAVEGAALAVVLKADQGDDAGDEWKLGVADGGVLTLGNDIASAGTYVTGLTITPNSTTAAWLLDFEGDVDVGGDTLSFNAAATIDTSGNNNLTLSAGTADVVVTASNLAPASNDGSAIGVSGTAWSDVFLASGAVVNFNAGDVTLTHSSNTLTVAGGTLATAALTASTITASGIVKTDDTTDATSTTDGSLQTDGGLSVAKDAVIGDDLKLLSDSAVLSLGADSDATLTHDGTTGVTIAANPITVDSGAALTLDAHTGVFVFKDAGSEVLRFTEGNSGDVTVKLATNGKDLVFTDNGDATNMKILDAAAGINVPGEVQTTKIAYTDGDDAITIADGGGATFSQTLTVGSNGSGKDVQFYGDTSGSNVLVDASADDLILTNFGLAVGSDATGDVYYRDANGFLARLGVGSNGQVLTTNGTIPSWGSAGGDGDFSGPGSATDNALVRFDGTGGKTGQNSGVIVDDSNNVSGIGTLAVTGDVTVFDDQNNADTSLSIGTGTAEALVIQALNGTSNKTLEELRLTTKTASGTADHGKVTVYVDEAHIADVDDSGINLASGKTFRINGTNVVASAGDFSGPGSSTDNAIVRFDGTGGKTGQNSGVTIDDSNNATGFANLTLSGELQTANIGYTDGDNAITIADGGGCTFPQDATFSGDIAAATLDISGNIDIDGTTNLDAVDIDGAVQIDSTLTVGVDGTGYDAQFFGASAGHYMLWDQSADEMILRMSSADAYAANTETGNLKLVNAGSDTDNQSVGIAFDVGAGNVGAIGKARIDAVHNGTGANSDLVFATQASGTVTERLRIDTSGYVGVNKTSLSNRFESVESGSSEVYAVVGKATGSGYNLQAHGTSGDVTGTGIFAYMESSSPADNDFAGAYNVQYKDSGGNKVMVGSSGWFVTDVTAGTIDSYFYLRVYSNNSAVAGTLSTSGVWTDSSAAANKEYYGTRQEVWPDGVLPKLKTLRVSKYKQADLPDDKPITETHVSPTAEDFWDAFQVGQDPRREVLNAEGEQILNPSIAPKDLSGVALVAVQELLDRVEAAEAKIAALESA